VKARWEHFAHGADIGVRGIGSSLAEAFAQTALALTAVVVDPATVSPRERVTIRVTASDNELLLVAWLNALVYEMATRGLLFSRFDVELEQGSLSAAAWGEPVDLRKHEPVVEVKGATYTELKVHQTAGGAWTAQCVVDV
jgi:SHS2 domain-containing protein